MVEVVEVRKHFGDLEVLRGISLSVPKGQTIVIIGPSGSGKSTLLRTVNCLETIDDGRIFVEGELIGYREVNGRLRPLPERVVARQRR
jgi:polar amino acid transport system ATP-binding protein